jgi:DNA-binding MarR family transcriptional regulator
MWIFRDFIRTMAEFRIRPAQFSVLTLIGANPGLSQALVSQTLGIERGRLVGLIDELERRKLARRARSPSDKRSHSLFLTAKGEEVLNELTALADRHERVLADKLGAEGKEALLRLLAPFMAE